MAARSRWQLRTGWTGTASRAAPPPPSCSPSCCRWALALHNHRYYTFATVAAAEAANLPSAASGGPRLLVAVGPWLRGAVAFRATAPLFSPGRLDSLNPPARPLRPGQACGVDYTLTEEAVEEGEVDALREELDQLAQQVGAGGGEGRGVQVSAGAAKGGSSVCKQGRLRLRRGKRGSDTRPAMHALGSLHAPSPLRPRPARLPARQEGLVDHWRGGTKAAARAFRGNYLELWAKLMREAYAADQGLFDQHLLDRLSSLLTALNTWVAGTGRSGGPAGREAWAPCPWLSRVGCVVWACMLTAPCVPCAGRWGRLGGYRCACMAQALAPPCPLACAVLLPRSAPSRLRSPWPSSAAAHLAATPTCLSQVCGARVPLGGHPDRRPAGHRLDPRQPGAGRGAGHRRAPAGGRAAQEGRRQGGGARSRPARSQRWASGAPTAHSLGRSLLLSRSSLLHHGLAPAAAAVPPSRPRRRPPPTAWPPSSATSTAATRASRSCAPTRTPSSRASLRTASGALGQGRLRPPGAPDPRRAVQPAAARPARQRCLAPCACRAPIYPARPGLDRPPKCPNRNPHPTPLQGLLRGDPGHSD